MKLLLDTHALIWFLEDHAHLSDVARVAISHPENQSFVSDATAWEVGIKHSLGKLDLPVPYEDLFPSRLQTLGFQILPIRHAHLHEAARLPWHHRDPFDRLLIAQARVESLVLVSRDTHFPAYGVPILWG
ncbi:PIN domain nuclease, a component of toxin-antitoxin system (PIN domain) [Prosthecobacter debontii]|uniref:PIN domain nuclease, a component of toxin-antitoxin system (PIN domain) n=1 Tax=Prosthecobacter debontii TaxID=48467 RepID=A0A1T4YIM9_9BACT|nr:type II toxin-antitoxin system VapC family toxin [Prosthecobacter debontii]SKB01125.1 PIN domain nuclease, a component of toxin-antitoxin system (PIN domain) [Prosthecobacter debontii]